MKLKQFAFFIVLPLIVVSCRSTVYSDSYDVHDGWSKDSVLTFEVDLEQTPVTHQTEIVLRNNDSYSYQNIWFFVEFEQPNGEIKRDTLQYFVADNLGRWTGSGIGSIFENVLIVNEKQRFSKPGKYKISLWHAMREDKLFGLENVGIRIE